jgi:naphthalene 1,2-dioxygenase system ferredoxin subunit
LQALRSWDIQHLTRGAGTEERTMSASENWITVAKSDALEPGSVIGVKAGDLDVALYSIDGQIYATDNICTHAHAHLSDGWLEDDIIECPLHGGRFEVKSGKGLGAPITCDVKTFPVRIEGDAIQVNVA